ncbi:chromosome segregation protein SMC [Bacillus capparidis]|uniref:Chromosome partition protein Smc n=1 Tax=Bacillus capparidis TaxID=1840411 RepID=A0ABS4CQY3_9BACI|nr:chromosome segregation protein SMC [Bacillus capparidis]MBP1079986.1 chromosome segregation protein [Bacillus capparidis]MED1095374.1 chromosome segregation protein SMC [Bacillus capparidis]
MFLKRLDIIGFKSFAEKISVDFVKGVTAVVGPNGSGKSNITDAIRWVLGEQSAKSLRGGKMEDVIFAGSDSRKRMNLAEVTLTLENEDRFLPIDYHEVSVTRRVFRSGESEFLINKQACRLKDIIDLFMDSGLGKEAFSIISQGKVEEILSSKAEERRSIFEEAAGVLKYKSRKKKAEAKLLETQDNLNRVEDIIHELEGQVEPLKVQASIAKDYLDKKAELENVEISLTAYDIEKLNEDWTALSRSVEEAKGKEIASSASIQAKEADISETRDKIQALDESVDELQQILLVTSEELEKLEGRKEVLKERKKNATQNQEQLEEMIAKYSDKTKELDDRICLQSKAVEELQAKAEEIRLLLKEKQHSLSLYSENIEGKIEQVKSDYFELLNDQASIRNELQFIEDQTTQNEAKKKRLTDNNLQYIKERDEIKDRRMKCEAQLGQIEEQINRQVLAYREAERKYENDKQAYAKKESGLYQAYQYVQQAKSKKEMLEAMQEDFSGFYQGVKEILKAKSKLSGVHGAILELINTKEAYETAIEIALGAAGQHIVTENENSARQAIQYLKQNSFGRATFLPLNVMKARHIAERDIQIAKENSSFIGVAVDLIEFEGLYRPVVQNLLGAVLIAEDLKGANELAKRLGQRYRIVTLQGDVVNPGGSMTGGAMKKKNTSLLSRNRELETLSARLLDMEEKTELLEKDLKVLKNTVGEEEKRLDELRKNGEHVREKQQELKGELYEIQIEEKNINRHLELYDQEKSTLLEEETEKNRRKEELQRNLTDLTEKMEQLDEQLEQLNQQKQAQTSNKDSISSEVTELKIQIAKAEQALTSEETALKQFYSDREENEQGYKQASEDLKFLTDEMYSSSSGEEKLQEAASQKSKDKNNTLALISTRREQRIKLQSGLDTKEAELKEEKRLYKQMTSILKDQEVKLAKMEVELDNLLSFLREEYGLSYEAAKENYTLETPPEEARKQVKLIKMAIDELGTVNLGSIEEFERVNERYMFLKEQKDDLLEAKETLFKVIEEMDEEMSKRFSQTFSDIRSHFETVFKALFGGGRAELKLTNPDDLLRSGVDIVAQPPGKKLQNLSLLSGGERALTAIALLFSILKVRPVPFCILDEVEAALDEANVFRFAQYLKNYSHETQFIVITHRKGTMEEADVLYGVTMQGSGVSKLVSVKLEETKELVQ